MSEQQPYKPNAELIRQYLAGELDDKAMHALERQALDDPFLAEALEGYARFNPDQDKHLADLSQRLKERVAESSHTAVVPGTGRVRTMYRMAAAAVILLLITAGGWWLWQEQAGPPKDIVRVETTDTAKTSDSGNIPIPPVPENKPVAAPMAKNEPAVKQRKIRKGSSPQPAMAAAADTQHGLMADEAARTDSQSEMAYSQQPRISAFSRKDSPAMAKENSAAASQVLVTGQVQDNISKEALPGAMVGVRGTSSRTFTDTAGRFRLSTDTGATLVVTALGYNSKKITVSQQDTGLNIAIQPAPNALSEVVVTEADKKEEAKNIALPVPAGGYSNYKKYLIENRRYPVGETLKSGNVRVSFRVMPDGSLQDFRVRKQLSPAYDAEAIRLIKEGPAWAPAANGRPRTMKVTVKF